jgi:segregation and condensation protein B
MQEPDIKSETADTPEVNESQGLTLVAAPEEDAQNAIGAAEPAALPLEEEAPAPVAIPDEQLQAVLEAVVYIAEEPLTLAQISNGLRQPVERVESILRRLTEEFERAEHGIGVREVAGGFKMATKAEHHEAVRSFVKSLKPPLKLSLPALETLAVIAYKQPVTAPEIIGKPILYKTTKEFLIQFGLKDIAELPSLKEFEEIWRMAFADSEVEPAAVTPAEAAPVEATPVVEAAPAESKTEAPAEPESQAPTESETQSAPEPEPES